MLAKLLELPPRCMPPRAELSGEPSLVVDGSGSRLRTPFLGVASCAATNKWLPWTAHALERPGGDARV
eukprot:8026042-Pyramimonas_sp.AAC.1